MRGRKITDRAKDSSGSHSGEGDYCIVAGLYDDQIHTV